MSVDTPRSCKIFVGEVNPLSIQVTLALLGRPDLNVNFTGKRELSPIMLACIEGNRRVVECILEREDMDINTIGKDGVLPASKGTWP